MKKLSLIALYTLLSALFAFFLFTPFSRVSTSKPIAPIDLDVKLVGRGDGTVPFGLIVTASPQVHAELAIRVTLPDGTSAIAGPTIWKGRLRTGQRCELRMDLVCSDPTAGEILVTAEIVLDEKTRIARCTSVPVRSSPPKTQGVRRINAAGEGILDFQHK